MTNALSNQFPSTTNDPPSHTHTQVEPLTRADTLTTSQESWFKNRRSC